MEDSQCEMADNHEKEHKASSPSEAIGHLMSSSLASPEDFIAKLKESGYELKPIQDHSVHERHGFLPPPPKMVIVRLDAARNALKG
jgi:hypothetical protein